MAYKTAATEASVGVKMPVMIPTRMIATMMKAGRPRHTAFSSSRAVARGNFG